jgi:hypothetical protein
VNALHARSGLRLTEGEARSKESGLEQEVCQVVNRLVGLVSLDLLSEFLDDDVGGVQFNCSSVFFDAM